MNHTPGTAPKWVRPACDVIAAIMAVLAVWGALREDLWTALIAAICVPLYLSRFFEHLGAKLCDAIDQSWHDDE